MMTDQLKKKLDAFNAMKAKLESEHPGRIALLHDGKLISIYNDSGDAYAIGKEKYGLGNFSIETIGEKPKSLGFFTSFVPANG